MVVPRLVIPSNTQLSRIESAAGFLRHDLMVARRLIPANARIEALAEFCNAVHSPTVVSRNLMVPKLLVPANTRIEGVESGGAAGTLPRVARQDIFRESLLNKASLGHRRNPAEWFVSLGIHGAILAVVLITPLFYTQIIDMKQFDTTYLATPQTPMAPPPPVAMIAQQTSRRSHLTTTATLTIPMGIPKTVQMQSSASEAPPEIAGVPGGIVGGMPGGQIGGVLGGILEGIETAAPAVPAAPPPPPAPSQPIRITGDMKPPRSIYRPEPEYPKLARQTRVQGVVEINAIIDRSGNVVNAHAIKGPFLLISAALKAVTEWKYEPFYMNGQPCPIELTVHVTFKLAS